MMRRTFSWLEMFQFEFIFHEKQTFFDVSFPVVEVVIENKIVLGFITFDGEIKSKQFSCRSCLA